MSRHRSGVQTRMSLSETLYAQQQSLALKRSIGSSSLMFFIIFMRKSSFLSFSDTHYGTQKAFGVRSRSISKRGFDYFELSMGLSLLSEILRSIW